MTYQYIQVTTQGKVGIIQLDRPKVLNALNNALLAELGEALNALDANADIGCMIVTGNNKAFAAGVDIAGMAQSSMLEMRTGEQTRYWHPLRDIRKPVIAAVAGYALGGGCELAMLCDFIIAADNAQFGQPEVKLGILPGMGGTQRLPRAVSKSKAMDMCLTARMMNAEEAERAGLVSRVVPVDALMAEAVAAAATIAEMSQPVVAMIKEAINRAYESPLAEGLLYESNLFSSAFATEDQKEGMQAFLEKRVPRFRHQ